MIRELPGRELQVITFVQLSRLGLIYDHTDEGARRDRRVDCSKSAVGNPLFDIPPDVILHVARNGLKEDFRQLVPFESAKEEEAHQGVVFAVKLENIEREGAEESAVVFAAGGFLQVGFDPVGAFFGFVVEYCGVEGLLTGEVPEDDGFADAGPFSDLFGGGSAEPFFREERGCNGHDLPPSVGPRHPPRFVFESGSQTTPPMNKSK
jgi:hypothetical protein